MSVPSKSLLNDDDIVISGISGRFPDCDNVEEFAEKLLAGIDLVSEDDRRWPQGFRGLPTRFGKIKNLDRFDATFFGIYTKQAHKMDPQQRLTLETTYEAIIDAGFNPSELRGSKTGVFVGVWENEADMYWRNDDRNSGDSYVMTTPMRALMANRVSFFFDLKGPSYTLDSACSSSFVALQNAMVAIQSGQCDSAIVVGANVCLLPATSLYFQQMGMIGQDGKCRAFDAFGKGYVRAEAVVSMYLQKASAARRIYSHILGAKINTDGHKEMGIIHPSGTSQYKLIKSLYDDFCINFSDVTYLEAHGTGTPVGDPEEVNALARLFCKHNKEPLLIGSVKSNMGHAESAAGICSIAKAIITMQRGVIPQNLHYETPNPNIPALLDGRLKVVSKNEPWKTGLIGISSFGIGGTNAHVVLQPHLKPKTTLPQCLLPRLLVVSGRTEDGVKYFLDEVEKHKDDAELQALLYKIHSSNISGHPYRGYSILGKSTMEVGKIANDQRPIWFVYSGMGSQWRAMTKRMMELDPFKESIKNSSSVLLEHGIDLDLLLDADEGALADTEKAFVCLTAVQIALTDVLRCLGITPDGIIGHSLGEIGSGYGDGVLTAHQALMTSHVRGSTFAEEDLPPGMMAAVGITWEECKVRCPPNIYPACHNSKDNVTIAGPPDAVEEFVAQLQSENVFAKVVKGCKYAFHTKHVVVPGSRLMENLQNLIPDPKIRSLKWISSSIPESGWNTAVAQKCSAEYYVNSFQSPVLFYEALQHIPDNAVVIEIAPHGLLQPILKRSLNDKNTIISLMKRDCPDNIEFFLSAMGRLFNAGYHPKLSKLYPPITFPVSQGTTMIAPFIKWEHSEKWDVPQISTKHNGFGEVFTINLTNEEDTYLSGHVVDGRTVFPAAGYLLLAWKTFAKLNNEDFERLPVVFEDVKFHRTTIMPKDGDVRFLVNILKGSGEFDVSESDILAVSGKISVPEDVTKEFMRLPKSDIDCKGYSRVLFAKDVYTELRLRGYDYTDQFQGIVTADGSTFRAQLRWTNNWVTYIDAMMQSYVLGIKFRLLYLPSRIKRVVIDPLLHLQASHNTEDAGLQVLSYHNLQIIKSGGIEICDVITSYAHRRNHTKLTPSLEIYKFMPLLCTAPLEEATSIRVMLQIVLENTESAAVRVLESPGETFLGPVLKRIVELVPSRYMKYTVSNPHDSHTAKLAEMSATIITNNKFEETFNLVVLSDALTEIVSTNGFSTDFLLLEEFESTADKDNLKNRFEIVSVHKLADSAKRYTLLRTIKEDVKESIVIPVLDDSFTWLESLKQAMTKSEVDGTKIYLVAQGQPTSGIVGMVNCLSKEPGGRGIRSYFLRNSVSEAFSLSSELYATQIKKDLVQNVLDDTNIWGTYRHLELEHTHVKNVDAEHAFVTTTTRGDLSSLKWVQSPLAFHRSNKKAELCTVHYAPLNFRDAMIATAKLPSFSSFNKDVEEVLLLGLEFSGRDSSGRPVMGILGGRCLATTCVIDPELLIEVPKNWTLEEAATVPLVYATCYYAMIVRGQMKPGESILIHAGAGGVGHAAISIALHMKCKVFTTVSSQAKRDYLLKMFPQLEAICIGNSRDRSFEQLVLTQTSGRGVDLVLNSLAGQQLLASLRCLAPQGRFLEMGMVDMLSDTLIGLSTFMQNRSFIGIDLDDIIRLSNPLRKEINGMIEDGIRRGVVKPIQATVFPEDKIEEAFKLIASGKHTGRILIKIRGEQEVSPKTVSAIQRTYMDPYKTYIIIGGLGGFGLELTNWLITRGATKILITSRNGITTGYQDFSIKRWTEAAINVVISKSDASTLTGAENVIQEAKALGTIGGIFNLALVLHDATIQNLSENNFREVTKPKINVTKNLDVVSRRLDTTLEYFVVFSSFISGRGNIGQSNYGLANSAIERTCELRHASGLSGLAIQWGLVGDVGYYVNEVGNNSQELLGVVTQKILSCLETLDIFLKQPYPVVSSVVFPEKFQGVRKVNETRMSEAISSLLGINIKTASQTSTLAELGMDSLVGTEIRQTLERNYGVTMSAQEIRTLTFQRLEEMYNLSLSGKQVSSLSNVAETKPGLVAKDLIIKMSDRPNARTPVFFIHPIDGSVRALKSLSKLIEGAVYGIQQTLDCPTGSIENRAKHYAAHIQQVQNHGPYLIVGYSYGAVIAFEMALLLEAANETVTIVFVDGSHSYIKAYSDYHVYEHETECLIRFALCYKYIDRVLLKKELETFKTLDEKIESVARMLASGGLNSVEEFKTTATMFWERMVAASVYRPSAVIQGNVSLIRTKENPVINEHDYGLNKVCRQMVSVTLVDSNHHTIVTEPAVNSVAKVINDALNNM